MDPNQPCGWFMENFEFKGKRGGNKGLPFSFWLWGGKGLSGLNVIVRSKLLLYLLGKDRELLAIA